MAILKGKNCNKVISHHPSALIQRRSRLSSSSRRRALRRPRRSATEVTTERNKVFLLLLDVSGTPITQPAYENPHTAVLEHRSASTWCFKWPFGHAEPATEERHAPDPLDLRLRANGNTGSRHSGQTDKSLGWQF